MRNHIAYAFDVLRCEFKLREYLFRFRGTQALLQFSSAFTVLRFCWLYADIVDQRGAFEHKKFVFRQVFSQTDVTRKRMNFYKMLNSLRVALKVLYHLFRKLLYHFITSL